MPVSEKQLFSIIEEGTWKTEEEQNSLIKAIFSLEKFPIESIIRTIESAIRDTSPRHSRKKLGLITQVLSMVKSDVLGNYVPQILAAVDYNPDHQIIKGIIQNFDQKYIDIFINLFLFGDKEVSKAAKTILSRVGGKNVYFSLINAFRKIKTERKNELIDLIAKIGGNKAIPFLSEVAKGNRRVEKLIVLRNFAEIKSLASLDAILPLINDPDYTIREEVARTLGSLQRSEVIPHLITLLKDSKNEVVAQAMESLEKLGDPSVLNEIIPYAHHDHPKIRAEAIKLLGKIGDDRVMNVLIDRLRDIQPHICNLAFEALINLSLNQKIDRTKVFLELLGSRYADVRDLASEFVDKIADQSLAWRLVSNLKMENWLKQNIVSHQIARSSGSTFIEPLSKLLDDPNESVRRTAIETLSRIEDPQALKPILKALKDPDIWVQEVAVVALGNLVKEKSIPILIPLLKNEALRWTVLTTILNINSPKIIEPLIEVLPSMDSESKMEIAKFLGRFRTSQTLEAMTLLQNDQDKNVRLTATSILKRWADETSYAPETSKIYENVLENINLPLLDRLLLYTKDKGGTDLFISANCFPCLRYHREIKPIVKKTFSSSMVEDLILPILTQEQRDLLAQMEDLDFTYVVNDKHRFRVNIYQQRDGINAVFRIIPDRVPTLDEIKAPQIIKELALKPRGLLLIVGSTSMGKTTTAASIIDYINENLKVHIITIEDPIEYVHESKKAIVSQRGVGIETRAFSTALRSVLREDPDVIFIGELRDIDSFTIALNAAETGHLVIGTLHAYSAAKAIDRIINAFPPDRKEHVRVLLSENLAGIIHQQLVRKKDGSGVVAAFEVLVGTHSTANLIREKKTHQLKMHMVTNAELGMQTMDQALAKLYKEDIISREEAFQKCFDKTELEKLLELT